MAHMHYKGTGKVHSFRGLMDDGEVTKLRIQGPTGDRAYRISKFEIVPETVYTFGTFTMMVWRELRAGIAASASIDFSDDELLAVGTWAFGSGEGNIQSNIIFDNALFSRNIYITNTEETTTTLKCNYYIELEEVKLSKVGMAQLAVAAARRTIG